MTKSTQLPSIELLCEWLDYDSSNGLITWAKDRWYNARKGEPAGSICSTTGYRRIRLGNSRKLQAHRIAWMLHTGSDPFPYEIDHINGNRQDNRIQNLRLVDKKQNQLNRTKLNSNNTTGFTGVYSYYGKWKAGLSVDGKFVCIGVFDTKDAAALAWSNANERRRSLAGLAASKQFLSGSQMPILDAA
jgi:hypothetical protein